MTYRLQADIQTIVPQSISLVTSFFLSPFLVSRTCLPMSLHITIRIVRRRGSVDRFSTPMPPPPLRSVTFKTQPCNFLAWWSMQPTRNVFRADRASSYRRLEEKERRLQGEGERRKRAEMAWSGRGEGGGYGGGGTRRRATLGTVSAGLRESRRGLCVRRSDARWLNPRKKLEAQSCSAVRPTMA